MKRSLRPLSAVIEVLWKTWSEKIRGSARPITGGIREAKEEIYIKPLTAQSKRSPSCLRETTADTRSLYGSCKFIIRKSLLCRFYCFLRNSLPLDFLDWFSDYKIYILRSDEFLKCSYLKGIHDSEKAEIRFWFFSISCS